MWTFHLDTDVVLLTTEKQVLIASLELARQGQMTLDSFTMHKPGVPRPVDVPITGGKFMMWEGAPLFDVEPRKQAIVHRLLADFGATWRHLLRRQMKLQTLQRLSYAVVRLAMLRFTLSEVTEPLQVEGNARRYVDVTHLPPWVAARGSIFQAGHRCRVATAGDLDRAMAACRAYHRDGDRRRSPSSIYMALSLGHVALAKIDVGGHFLWTTAERLYDGEQQPTTRAMDMVIWATSLEPSLDATTDVEDLEHAGADTDTEANAIVELGSVGTRIHMLPLELQNMILDFATIDASPLARALYSCRLVMGSAFAWYEKGAPVLLQRTIPNRQSNTPVESQIMFGSAMIGLSYKLHRSCLLQAHEASDSLRGWTFEEFA